MHFYIGKKVEMGSQPESSLIGVNMLWDFTQIQTQPEGTYKSVVTRLLIDCHRMMAAGMRYKSYTEGMATGLVVVTSERDIYEAKKELKYIQNSVTKAVADFACKCMNK